MGEDFRAGNGDWDGNGGWVGLKMAGVCLWLREGFLGWGIIRAFFWGRAGGKIRGYGSSDGVRGWVRLSFMYKDENINYEMCMRVLRP